MANRYARKIDLNHEPIRDRLRQIPGLEVEDISKFGRGFPDLMIGGTLYDSCEPVLVFVELKSKRGKLKENQKKFAERWGRFTRVIEARSVSAVLMQGFNWPEDQAKSLDNENDRLTAHLLDIARTEETKVS